MNKISKTGRGANLTSTLFRNPVNLVNPVRTAFSLIEIVLALGIISFALVGIMGLLPVAMKSAQESQRETRAAQIAQQIFSDLHAMSPTNTFVAINTNILTSQLSVNLANASSNVISYAQDGLPLGQGTNTEAIYLAAVTVVPNVPVAGLSHVQATIETPALANSSNRSKYSFVTLMKQQ